LAEDLRGLDIEEDHPVEGVAWRGLRGDRGQAVALEEVEPALKPSGAVADLTLAARGGHVEPGHDHMREVDAWRHAALLSLATRGARTCPPPFSLISRCARQ